MEPLLQEAEQQPHAVAPRHAAQGDEGRPVEENPPQRAVAHPQRLEQANHPRPLQHQNQQRRGHVEESHHKHDAHYDGGVDVVGRQPVENVGIELAQRRDGEVLRLIAVVVEQAEGHPPREVVRVGEVVRTQLVARDLVLLPVGQPLHVAQVGEGQQGVGLVHARRVEARDAEAVAAGAHAAPLDEEHLDLVTHVELQTARHQLGEQHILRPQRVAHAGQLPAAQAAAQKRPVVARVDPLEQHPLHGVLRADNAAARGIGGHRGEALDAAEQLLEGGRTPHGLRIGGRNPADVGHHGMRRQPRQVADHLALEAHDDGQREEHHRHAQRHGDHRDAHHHAGLAARRGRGQTTRDEKGKVHDSGFYGIVCKVTYFFCFLITTLDNKLSQYLLPLNGFFIEDESF